MRLYDHYPALFRLTLGGNAVVSWYNAMNDPKSSLWTIGRHEYGGTLLWLMGFFGAVIVLDVLANDWTPDRLKIGSKELRLRWQRMFAHRHWLFVGLATCYSGQPYVAEMGGYGVSLVPYFYWYAFTNLAVAYLDANKRSRSQGWEKACS
jgi:hypothetical protein